VTDDLTARAGLEQVGWMHDHHLQLRRYDERSASYAADIGWRPVYRIADPAALEALVRDNERLREALEDVRHQASDTTQSMLDALNRILRIARTALYPQEAP
jgi:hypothetical protein